MVARSFSASASAFQSTPSTRRVTMMSVVLFSLSRFQSTPSTRRVTRGVGSYCLTTAFQSTPSTRRVTHERNGGGAGILFQSTPSTRRVTQLRSDSIKLTRISIHTLHTEGDIGAASNPCHFLVFQSTPSTRRVTCWKRPKEPEKVYFNPHPPHGG